MPRKLREKSNLGIYHVMLRGINKNNIFFDDYDFCHMLRILHDIPIKKDRSTGKVISYNQCTIYAYCILDNHIHLLIREADLEISQIMQIIADRYAVYYNKRHERLGHLFQGRFESEAINDENYFRTVFRYIAQNPTKAKEALKPEDYPYSSWNEYTNNKSNILRVLKPVTIQVMLDRYPLNELTEWINTFNDDRCLDIDEFRNTISDKKAWEILSDISKDNDQECFRRRDSQTQIYYLLQAIEQGVNLTQAARLGTITRYQIEKVYNKKFGDTSKSGSDPDSKENLEKAALTENFSSDSSDLQSIHDKIRTISGMSKKTYHQLHLIAEYLYANPNSKCVPISEAMKLSPERIRQYLVLLANENIVTISGEARNRIYKLK